jgi:glycosyltransferase involved in cell wall biosynthesis
MGRYRSLGYVLMGYPRVSETFIASEVLRVERAGVPLRLFVIKPVEERERSLRHPVVDAIRARPQYLPDTSSLTLPLHLWRPRHLRPFLPALRRTARRRPLGLVRATWIALGLAMRNRRSFWSGPRKVNIKELLQGIALADRVLDAPDVGHLHAHFAHGTTTVTWLAAEIAGLPFSFTGHARDIYAEELNPGGLLRRKLRAARFAVTCTEANRRYLQAIAPDASVHLVYHGLGADIEPATERRAPGNGRLRVLGVGRLVEKKGFDVLVEACAELARRQVPFEARIVGQDDKHAPEVRRRIERLGLENRVRLPGPMDQTELSREYRRASVFCLPCRVLPGDRDGLPNVLVEAMASGLPVVTTGVSGIPELVSHEANGLLVPQDDPDALADALVRLHEDRELGERLATAGAQTVRESFDGDVLTGRLAALFREALGTEAPRPVFCVTAHERRDLGVAQAVSEGRFTFAGVTCELGTVPDWLGAALPPDEEWRIEWSKFYYARDLAFAFAETGDVHFLRAWERLVDSWIAQVPAGHDTSDVAARRIQNWIYAWQDFASAPAFPGLAPGLPERLAGSIAEQASHVRHTLSPERNHRTLELYALFLVPLALPSLDPDGELLAFATAELERALRAEFRSDGVHRESSTHYHLIALRSFLGARENARRFGLRFSRDFDEMLDRACDFALHCARPDGAIPALSDADTGRYGELLALAGDLLGRGDLLYAATGGRRGTAPARRHVSFEAGGYHVQRSGWGEGDTPYERERFLIFDCGPLGDGGHGHYDLLSVEVAASGRPLLVDPGRYTYSEESPNLRRWFKGTAAHNTVCVDGLDQTPYRRGRPDGPVAEGRFLGRVSAPGLDVLAGEARSPVYEAVHTRVVAFVDDRCWIVEDRLRGERAHRYDLRFHLGPEALGEARLEGPGVRAPGLGLVLEPGPSLTLEPGWVAPVYGRRVDAPVVSAVVEGVADANFVTLVVPLAGSDPLPELRVRREDGRTEVEVDGRAVAWRLDAGELVLEAGEW